MIVGNYFCKRRRGKLDQKKYTEDGFLFVSELERCPYFEKSPSTYQVCGNEDCFYCKFSDFRKREYDHTGSGVDIYMGTGSDAGVPTGEGSLGSARA